MLSVKFNLNQLDTIFDVADVQRVRPLGEEAMQGTESARVGNTVAVIHAHVQGVVRLLVLEKPTASAVITVLVPLVLLSHLCLNILYSKVEQKPISSLVCEMSMDGCRRVWRDAFIP